jgi:hypothetical protein
MRKLTILAAVLVVLACGKHETDNSAAPTVSTGGGTDAARLSLIDAWKRIEPVAKAGSWKVAYISNTGVSQTLVSMNIHGATNRLMNENGDGGEWVFEMFKDTPKAITHEGKKGWEYPFTALVVTATGVETMQVDSLSVPKKLHELGEGVTYNMNTHFQNAAQDQKAKKKYDFASATTVVSAEDCTWLFKFYDVSSGEIVGKIQKPCK